MRLLIKYIESRGIGKETHQSTYEGDVATIGRGTDQTIQIADRRLPLSHSRLTVAAGKLSLAATGDYRFAVNGESSRRAPLAVGDKVNISGHSLKVCEGEAGVDYVLEVELVAETVEKLRDRFQTRLRDVSLPTRGLAWVLFLVILVGTLLIPTAGLYSDQMATLRELPLPDDGQWISGELHQNHAFLGDDCSGCHVKPFVATRNEDCLACHQTINHHFDTSVPGLIIRSVSAAVTATRSTAQPVPSSVLTRRSAPIAIRTWLQWVCRARNYSPPQISLRTIRALRSAC